MVLNEAEQLVGRFVYSREVAKFLEMLGGPRFDRFADLEVREYAGHGLAIYINKDRQIVSVFLHGAKDETHATYTGPVPRGLSFADTRKEVTGRLGVPSASGKIRENGADWDRFDSDTVSMHVQYRPDSKGIEMITLMTPGMARGEL